MAGQEMPTCGVGVSIAQGIHLLLHTRYGELRSDRSYGCSVWELEFDRSVSSSHWINHLCESMEEAIQQHEPRLKNPQVTVQFQSVERGIDPIPEDYQRRATVTVQAILCETDEPFRFSTQLHLGQLLTR